MERSNMTIDQLIELAKKQADSLEQAKSVERTKEMQQWMCAQAFMLSTTARILAWKLEDLG